MVCVLLSGGVRLQGGEEGSGVQRAWVSRVCGEIERGCVCVCVCVCVLKYEFKVMCGVCCCTMMCGAVRVLTEIFITQA